MIMKQFFALALLLLPATALAECKELLDRATPQIQAAYDADLRMQGRLMSLANSTVEQLCQAAPTVQAELSQAWWLATQVEKVLGEVVNNASCSEGMRKQAETTRSSYSAAAKRLVLARNGMEDKAGLHCKATATPTAAP